MPEWQDSSIIVELQQSLHHSVNEQRDPPVEDNLSLTNGVSLTAMLEESSLGKVGAATIDADKAIAIYLAKARHAAGDMTSGMLAAEHGITKKAVRDVWNLRTWPWITMPYWSQSDLQLFLSNHLCAECRRKGVQTLDNACSKCSGPRRRGRPVRNEKIKEIDQNESEHLDSASFETVHGILQDKCTETKHVNNSMEAQADYATCGNFSPVSKPSAEIDPAPPSSNGDSQPPQPRLVNVIPRSIRTNCPVKLDLQTIQGVIHMRLPDAAKCLGICETTLKQVCRKLGIARWPRLVRKKCKTCGKSERKNLCSNSAGKALLEKEGGEERLVCSVEPAAASLAIACACSERVVCCEAPKFDSDDENMDGWWKLGIDHAELPPYCRDTTTGTAFDPHDQQVREEKSQIKVQDSSNQLLKVLACCSRQLSE
jgi:hypothetical protein